MPRALRAAMFRDGPPCRRGHTVRYVKGGACVACHRASMKDARPAQVSGRTHDDLDAAPSAQIVVRPAGCCRHGRRLSDYCRECEGTYRNRPPVVLEPIVMGEL